MDIPRGRLYRWDPELRASQQCYEDEPIGGFTIQADGALLLFMARGAVKLWREKGVTTVIDEIPEDRDTLFNDTIADPRGRVFAGMKAGREHAGKLYRLDTNGRLVKVLDGVGEPNGMGFTTDRRHMYFTDTYAHAICIFDYDIDTGDLGDRQAFVKVPETDGAPDGMTVDAEGFVWAAHWGGGCIVRYFPDGTEERRIRLPVAKTSSLTFGGDDYTHIYVTSAGGDRRDEEGPLAGSLFRLDLGIRGVPEFESRVGLG